MVVPGTGTGGRPVTFSGRDHTSPARVRKPPHKLMPRRTASVPGQPPW